jgi:type I restriction enzyme S subunit
VIPEGWRSTPVAEIADIVAGGTPSTGVSEYWDGDIPWCTPTDITSTEGKTLNHTERTITQAGLANSAANLLPDGSLLLCTRATVGDVRIAGRAVATNQGFKSLVVKSPNDHVFIYYQIATLRNRHLELSSGSTFLELSKKDLARVELLLPPPVEQKAIADALSDADALVEALDALIAKKRDMKHAAMQQLLTGRTRLPGYTDEWEEVRLGELLDYEQPTKYLVNGGEYQDSGSIPVLTAGKSFLLGYTSDTEGVYDKGPTILFDDFTTATQWVEFPFKVKSSACKMLTSRRPEVSLRFVYELMRTISYVPTDHMRHWIGIASEWPVIAPQSDEQQAIAEVLSDMDAEIVALVAQREKAELIEQGMMQELLSGRIRLV